MYSDLTIKVPFRLSPSVFVLFSFGYSDQLNPLKEIFLQNGPVEPS